jgi:hypothetical protein
MHQPLFGSQVWPTTGFSTQVRVVASHVAEKRHSLFEGVQALPGLRLGVQTAVVGSHRSVSLSQSCESSVGSQAPPVPTGALQVALVRSQPARRASSDAGR